MWHSAPMSGFGVRLSLMVGVLGVGAQCVQACGAARNFDPPSANESGSGGAISAEAGAETTGGKPTGMGGTGFSLGGAVPALGGAGQGSGGIVDAGGGGSAGEPMDGSAGAAGAGGDSAGGMGPSTTCGNGTVDADEECDLGAANRPSPYGEGLCSTNCSTAPFCGDGKRNGAEACDGGGSDVVQLGACNPECTAYYEKKFIRLSNNNYSTDLGGPSGADAKCRAEFGSTWKALLVGGNRRATVTPNRGDMQSDWVLSKYTYYYNAQDQLIWTTDSVNLLGVRNGNRVNLYADVFALTGRYPWAGFAPDWTTLEDGTEASQGTCDGWTQTDGHASFITPDFQVAANEACGSTSAILCVEQ